MKKKGLVMVLVLLCLASLLVAMAYTSAEVKAGYTIDVVNTNEALLALVPNSLNSDSSGAAETDKNAYVDDKGNLVLYFGRISSGGSKYGLQPGSTYIWKDLVIVKNHSLNKIKVNLVVEAEASYVSVTDANGSPITADTLIDHHGTLSLTFKVTVPDAAVKGTTQTGKVIVKAEVTS